MHASNLCLCIFKCECVFIYECIIIYMNINTYIYIDNIINFIFNNIKHICLCVYYKNASNLPLPKDLPVFFNFHHGECSSETNLQKRQDQYKCICWKQLEQTDALGEYHY